MIPVRDPTPPPPPEQKKEEEEFLVPVQGYLRALVLIIEAYHQGVYTQQQMIELVTQLLIRAGMRF